MDVELYHAAESPFSMMARLALEEKRVQWRSHRMNILAGENLKPSYLALNPEGVVPTLVHDGNTVTDAAVIAAYVAESFDGPDLAAGDLGLIEAWMKLVDTLPLKELDIEGCRGLRRFFLRTGLKRSAKRARKLARKKPQLSKSYRARVDSYEKSLAIMRDGVPAADTARLEQVMDTLHLTLEQQRWLAGDRYTLADIYWTVVLHIIEKAGLDSLWQTGKRPQVARYYAHLQRRPSYQIAITDHERFFSRLRTFLGATWKFYRWRIVLLVILALAALNSSTLLGFARRTLGSLGWL